MAPNNPPSANPAARFLAGADHATALITNEGPVNYAMLRARIGRYQHGLRAAGVGRGSRVLIALDDGLDFVALWFAVQAQGAITAEISCQSGHEQVRYYSDYVEPDLVVAEERVAAKFADVAHPGPVLSPIEVFGPPGAPLDPVPVAPEDEAIWKFTSGSTGRPRACRLPAAAPLLSLEGFARGVLKLGPDDIVLPVPGLHFGYARDLAALFPLAVGGSGIVFREKSTPDYLFDLITAHRPTVLVNLPSMMAAMVRHPRAATADLSSLRVCLSAAEPLPETIHRDWEQTFGVEVLDFIGASEAYHGFISNRPGHTVSGSLGTPVPGYHVSVRDSDGAEVAAGLPGRLEVRSKAVALGYWHDDDASAAAFPEADTWRSEDAVTRDAAGRVHYLGRFDELVKVSGQWGSPTAVHSCLLKHPAIRDCLVTAQLNEYGLIRTVAFVVTDEVITEEVVREHVRRALSGPMAPNLIVFVDELPRNPNGKVDRRALLSPGSLAA